MEDDSAVFLILMVDHLEGLEAACRHCNPEGRGRERDEKMLQSDRKLARSLPLNQWIFLPWAMSLRMASVGHCLW